MEKLDKIVEIKSENKMNLEIDPRSKTTADGTKKMLKEKSRKAKWI
jgi:hypothetical protein